MMTAFAELHARAAERAGGTDALEDRLPHPADAATLRERPDAWYLDTMGLRIFRAGLKHAIVDAKWPAFREAFHGFEPDKVRALTDEELERLAADSRLIRHPAKMKALRANAAAVLDVAAEYGGVGAYLAAWPADRVVALWRDLGRRFQQLGGNSAAYFLRMAGKDTFVLTPDVKNALVAAGAVDRPPKAKRDVDAAGAAIAAWARESGRPLCQVSQILALAHPAS